MSLHTVVGGAVQNFVAAANRESRASLGNVRLGIPANLCPFLPQLLPGWTAAPLPIRSTSTTCADDRGECSRGFVWRSTPARLVTPAGDSKAFRLDFPRDVLTAFCVFVVTHQVHSGGSVTQGHANPGGRVSDDLLTHL